MWAAGVSLFILLGGYPPFDAANTKAVFKRVVLEEVCFDSPVWGSVNEPAKRLICNLLHKDCTKRMTAAQALQDEFIVGDWQAEVRAVRTKWSLSRHLHFVELFVIKFRLCLLVARSRRIFDS